MRKIRSQSMKDSLEIIERVFHQKSILYLLKIIKTKIISRYHDDLLANNFKSVKTLEFIAQNNYWPFIWANVKAYVKDFNLCLASKMVCHKSYGDLHLLTILTNC